MNPTKPAEDWQSGAPYERYMGRWSRVVAPRFLRWLRIAPAQRWLDVGCGTGELAAAILDACAPASVTGVEPSDGFRQTAGERLMGRALLHAGTAAEIPLADAAVDATVSALVLNFLPDAPAALREMARVTADGGCVGAYVWDYAGKMDMIRIYWDAAVEVDPQSSRLEQGGRFALCHPDALADLFTQAGLQQVKTGAIDIDMPFRDFDDFWQPFMGGQGPAPSHAMSLDEPTRNRIRDKLRERLEAGASVREEGGFHLSACAWAVRGSVAR